MTTHDEKGEVEVFEGEVQQQLNTMADLVDGKAWGVKYGKPRIYMPSMRDRKVYFAFQDYPTGDDKNLLGGACLLIRIEDCGQHPNWYKSQKDKIFRRLYRESLALQAWSEASPELARRIMTLERDAITASVIDEVGGHLVNGRVDEAEARIAALESETDGKEV